MGEAAYCTSCLGGIWENGSVSAFALPHQSRSCYSTSNAMDDTTSFKVVRCSVVAGCQERVEQFEAHAREQHGRYVELNVVRSLGDFKRVG
eukprot:CAMPEP_0168737312 /NCGR_PEP_ID=MMETSP0724-20121128/10330_1 /TAXON_ID=265536 /ORGANISM="Amphiprora sp., Strain CCMP467" /LENGTH=90 /DNA_ID=CAMNT_0008784575 /DNA_START=479 /DNA_END=751 /DNA_ORIENTATION=+